MWTENFQMYKLDLEKAEEPEIKLPTFVGSQKKQESSRKTPTSALLTTLKLCDCVDLNKLENYFFFFLLSTDLFFQMSNRLFTNKQICNDVY